eukprot:522077-Hanusia_phi.AAC.1
MLDQSRPTGRQSHAAYLQQEGGAQTDLVRNVAAPLDVRSLSDVNVLPSEERMLALMIRKLDQPVYASLREQSTLFRKLHSDLLSSLWKGISDEDFIQQYSEMEGVSEEIQFLERQLGSVSNSHSTRSIDRSLLDRYHDANYRLRQMQLELRLGSRDSPYSSVRDRSQAAQAVATSPSSSLLSHPPTESRQGKRSLSSRASEAPGVSAAGSSSLQRQPKNKRAKGSRAEGNGGSFLGYAPEPSGEERQRRDTQDLREAVSGSDVSQKGRVLVGDGNATGGVVDASEEVVSRAGEVSCRKTRDSNRHKRLPADISLPGIRESRLNESYPRRNLTISE